jgi:peptidoglycan hydrolase CwlO-like protein
MALWRDAPDTQKIIERAEKTRADLEAFISELNSFVQTLNHEIDEQEDEEEGLDA